MALSMSRWIGKVGVVTGASSGIGAAIATKLVEEGITVVGVARRGHLLEELAQKLSGKKGRLYAQQADITKEEDVLKVFDWTNNNLGPTHILINNAGTFDLSANLTEAETSRWRNVLELNVLALCSMTREAFKIMKANNINGHIIHLNSVGGHTVAPMNMYSPSKHAVSALTEVFRLELLKHKSQIKVSSLSPGLVESELTIYRKGLTQDEKDDYARRTFIQPDDVANAAIFMLSTPEHVDIRELIIRPVGEKSRV